MCIRDRSESTYRGTEIHRAVSVHDRTRCGVECGARSRRMATQARGRAAPCRALGLAPGAARRGRQPGTGAPTLAAAPGYPATTATGCLARRDRPRRARAGVDCGLDAARQRACLLYTSDAAD